MLLINNFILTPNRHRISQTFVKNFTIFSEGKQKLLPADKNISLFNIVWFSEDMLLLIMKVLPAENLKRFFFTNHLAKTRLRETILFVFAGIEGLNKNK